MFGTKAWTNAFNDAIANLKLNFRENMKCVL